MIEVLVVLGIVWAVVTVVGHLTWIGLAAIFRKLLQEDTTAASSRQAASWDDLVAAKRVIGRLAAQRLIDPQQASQLSDRIDTLDAIALSKPAASANPSPAASSQRHSTTQKKRPMVGSAAVPPPQSSVRHRQDSDSQRSKDRLTADATASSCPSSTASSPPDAELSRPTLPATPKASLGQSIGEFLADHNIRWGELIAGLLIVVCSIGLVVSLWSTIAQMHRVIPSLIFLSGNAAIFGAGLYTLFRWRLPETSRATLVIAMLLVPLGILTGLSTGATDGSAVRLDDPVTVVAILAAAAIYLFLIRTASRALVGSAIGVAMTLSVAGTSAVLPFVPAAIRSWGGSAGLVIYAASAAIALATCWLARLGLRGNDRNAKRWATVIGLGLFSFAVSAIYAGYMLRESESAWLALAIAAVPAIVLLSGLADTIGRTTSFPSLALFASTVSICGVLAGGIVLVPAMRSMGWVWLWAISLSSAAALTAVLFRGGVWSAVAAIPIGIATLVSSPAWFTQTVWSEITFWQRVFGGQPMLVALAVGLLMLAIAALVRRTGHGRSLAICGAAWSGLAFVNALVLSVSPIAWMGNVPPFVLPVLLAGGAVAIAITERRVAIDTRLLVIVFYVFLAAGWGAILRPLETDQIAVSIRLLMQTLLAAGATGIIIAEVVPRRGWVRKLYRRYASIVIGFAAVFAAGLSSLPGVDVVTVNWALATLLFAWGFWNWIGFSNREPSHLVCARIATLAGLFLAGHRFLHETLFEAAAWRSGAAVWSWSAIGWGLVAAIALRTRCLTSLRRLVGQPGLSPMGRRRWRPNLELELERLVRRTGWYRPHEQAWDRDSFALLVQVVSAATILAALFGIGSTIVQLHLPANIVTDTRWGLPAGVLAIGLLMLHSVAKIERKGTKEWAILSSVLAAAAIVWAAWQTADWAFEAVESKLLAATSVAAIGCFALDLARRSPNERRADFGGHGIPTAIGLALIAVSSLSLLAEDWVQACLRGETPERWITLWVASWWTAGVVACVGLGYRSGKPRSGATATVLLFAAVILVMPLIRPQTGWQWLQAAGVAEAALVAILTGLTRLRRRTNASWRGYALAQDMAAMTCLLIGLATCVGVYAGMLLENDVLLRWHNVFGVLVSFSAALCLLGWHRIGSGSISLGVAVQWTSALFLVASHGAMLFSDWSDDAVSSLQALVVLWTVLALLAAIESWRWIGHDVSRSRHHRRLSVGLVIATPVLCWFTATALWQDVFALLACVIGGFLAAATGRGMPASFPGRYFSQRSGTRLLCWYVLAAGSISLWRLFAWGQFDEPQLWTMVVGWFAGWCVVWRWMTADRSGDASESPRRATALADFDAASCVALGLAAEVYLVCGWPDKITTFSTIADPMLWIRLFAATATILSICFRTVRPAAMALGATTILTVAALISMHLAWVWEAGFIARLTTLALVVSATYCVMVFSSGSLAAAADVLCRWMLGDRRMEASHRLPAVVMSRSLANAMLVPAAIAIGISSMLLIDANTHPLAALAVCSIAMMAVAVAESAERTGDVRIRYAAVATGMVAIAMWASCRIVSTELSLLTLTSRWFVAWVCTASLFAFPLPKLLAGPMLERWRGAIRAAFAASFLLAVISLCMTLGYEAMIRINGQTELLAKPLYLGVAAVLALISTLCTAGGILSGPGFSYRDAWRLTDPQRVALIVAAQVFGGLAWFHLFLCKSPLAGLGLRPYWPFVVMALSFSSVGITEWSRRRPDRVLATTLGQTALYLPLVPVIGFWLSGTWFNQTSALTSGLDWTYLEGRVPYQTVLVCAAVYYAIVSFLWKATRAKLISVVLGNAALWVILVQTPKWDFLSHPQAWLLPPAVCVLVLTHFHRNTLGPAATSAIRYAATLVIYVTSTADMLIQGIGSTLSGPIVLIVLALMGAAAGVALRVRPFLYLGTTFVFLAVASMVWHAQTQIGAVWPWWVFGIGTGIALLTGLMAIEKNKPKLRRLAVSMQQWEA